MKTTAEQPPHRTRILVLALVAASVLANSALPARAFFVNVGDIIIANYDNWQVVRLDPNTGEQVVWGDFLHPMDLALHPSGTLYIGEFYGDIQALDVATEVVAPLALSGDLPSEIWGLALGPNGRLYVTGKNLDDVDSLFEVNLDTGVSTIMTQGNLLSGVAGLATLDSTHLVVTSALANRLVSVSLVDHSQTTLISGGQVDSPYDVAVHGGKLFTGAYDSKWLLEVSGGTATVLANLLGSPWGIDIDADGIIAVGIKAADGGVQRFDQAGQSRGSFAGPSIGWVAGLEIADYGVFGPPKITTQPQSQAVARGANANFSVVAAGSTPLAYQWYFNQTQVISWGTGASLTVTNVQDASVGGYSVVVDNGVAVTSSIAQLTITKASTSSRLSSSANPAAPGQPVTFTMEVTAVAPGAGIPTGMVQFMLDGADTGAPASLSAGNATLSLTTISPGLHAVSASYAGDDNFTGSTATLASAQLINTPPTAGADTIQRDPTDGTKVLISTLLSNDADADGDPIELVLVSPTSAHGGSLLLDGDWIHYTPAAGFTDDDSFTYTIEDSYSAQATATVTVRASTNTVPSPNLLLTDLGNGSFLLSFLGIAGKTYRIEFTEHLDSAVWTELGSNAADDLGVFQYTNTPPPAAHARFYRSVYP
ncbi:MAG TPA: Ig-like domain repeat protein [Verrucomicrobiota bacterium]|nr:Ig-like domain repeat protein [Verrucomicrobiota bacterium]HRZ35162.1 Ig-like domain repeat protein [Candidatus Paceibacterota bacterium]HRZ54096.1 Ig-like domain repeat protein [Candidatus Paceibacterota bacterium]